MLVTIRVFRALTWIFGWVPYKDLAGIWLPNSTIRKHIMSKHIHCDKPYTILCKKYFDMFIASQELLFIVLYNFQD